MGMEGLPRWISVRVCVWDLEWGLHGRYIRQKVGVDPVPLRRKDDSVGGRTKHYSRNRVKDGNLTIIVKYTFETYTGSREVFVSHFLSDDCTLSHPQE